MVTVVASYPIAGLRSLAWAWRGLAAGRGASKGTTARTAVAVTTTIVLLVVFGTLFSAADAAFATVLHTILPTVDAQQLVPRIFTGLFVAGAVLAGCFLLAAPPRYDGDTGRRRLRRAEWALPVGALVALFTLFVGVEAAVLFGGARHVLATDGLTYAEYARQGFWQLLAVTVLTLLIIGVVARFAHRDSGADRVWLRVLLGTLSLLALVVVASAMSRMWTYEEAYGFTVLRLLVSGCELWLGLAFLLIMAAGVKLDGRWVPRAAAQAGAVFLVALVALNPDAFITDRNIDRFQSTGIIDTGYLATLSVDALPALARLEPARRACVTGPIAQTLAELGPDAWWQWNLARANAAAELATLNQGAPACAS
jgi:hypothetical protein